MKDSTTVNIVAFNVPYPPDFGGSIDVFYKIKALYEQGIRIYLHCFIYGNYKPHPELEKYCARIFYYPRREGLLCNFSILPYIVATRKSKVLLENLKNSGAPVIFEGLHTCGWIDHHRLGGIKKIVRMHNIEHAYYSELCHSSGKPFRKLFYRIESLKLKRFEKRVTLADCIAAISSSDQQYFESRYKKSVLIPAFHQYGKLTSVSGTGSYFLFHGNLSVEENQKAVEFLIKKVFAGIDIPLIIAGKNPSARLISSGKKFNNVTFRINPSKAEMDQLIGAAQGCILLTFQSTGIKLKLLGSLFAGRFCIVNEKMVTNTGLEDLCLIGQTENDFRKILKDFQIRLFTDEEIRKREEILSKLYSNSDNAKKLIRLIEELQT